MPVVAGRAGEDSADHDAAAAGQGLRQAAAIRVQRRRHLRARVCGGAETGTGGMTNFNSLFVRHEHEDILKGFPSVLHIVELSYYIKYYNIRSSSTRSPATRWCRPSGACTCSSPSPHSTAPTMSRARLFSCPP